MVADLDVRIQSGEMYFYYDSVLAGIEYRVYLDETVSGSILKEALRKTKTVHPYLTWNVREDRGDFYYVAADEEILLSAGNRFPALGTGDALGRLAAVIYYDNVIGFSFFHGLLDGLAAKRVLESIVYFYFCGKDSKAYPQEQVMTKAATEYETLTMEPYAKRYAAFTDKPGADTGITDKPGADTAFTDKPGIDAGESAEDDNETTELFSLLNMPENSGDKDVIQVIRLQSSRLMEYSRSNNASPSIAMGLLAAKAIQSLHPDNTKTIRINIPVNIRDALNIPDTFKNTTSDVALYVKPSELCGENIRQTGERLRGELKRKMDPDAFRAIANATMDFLDTAAAHKDYKSRFDFYNSLTAPTADTIFISYMGKFNANGYSEHIKGCDGASMPRDGFVFNIYDCGGNFNMSLIKRGLDTSYADAFIKVCTDEGIDAALVRNEEYELARVYLPVNE